MNCEHENRNRSEDDTTAYVVSDEEEVFTSAHGLRDDEEAVLDPFCRRSSLARTPPQRERQITLPLERVDRDKGRGDEKRKRSKDSPIEATKKPREAKGSMGDRCTGDRRERLLRKVSTLISKVDRDVEELYSITSGSRNTKVEIKDLAEKLSALMERLVGIDLGELVASQDDDKPGKVDSVIKPQTREMGTQTEQRGRLRSRRIDSQAEMMTLEDCPTAERWREVADRRWSSNLFTRTAVKEDGDVLTTDDNVIKVAVTLKEDNGPRNKKIWEKYPELLASTDEFAVLEQISNLRGNSDITVSRKIVKIITDGSEDDLWSKLVRVREEAGPEGRVAIQQVPGRTVAFLRKMLECVFLKTSTRVDIYTDRERPQKKARTVQTKPKTERDTYALVVEGTGGETYTEVLKRVKERVRSSTVSSKIKGLRSTRDGRLLITTEKDSTVADRVAEILGEPAQKLKISKTGQKGREIALHIRGLDALTTKQEIVGAVENRIGPLTGKLLRVSELRPNAGNTLAATLVLSKEDANKIIDEGKLRVGLVTCRVEKRLEVERCFRCWSYSHKARDCDGTVDRSKMCYRCGAEGHSAKTCDREEACPVCGVSGHTADSRKCRFFKRALTLARETERLKTSSKKHGERSVPTPPLTSGTNEPDRGPGPTGVPDPPLN